VGDKGVTPKKRMKKQERGNKGKKKKTPEKKNLVMTKKKELWGTQKSECNLGGVCCISLEIPREGKGEKKQLRTAHG